MKSDEFQFLAIMLDRCTYHSASESITRETPREIINSDGFPLHHKRAWFILRKWAGGLGWYDFGVSLDLGWLTEKGFTEMRALLTQPQQ